MPKKGKKWKTFGQRIRVLREEQGWSLEDLAHETGYTPELLGNIEDDNAVAPVSLVLQLSRTFKTDVSQLDAEEEKKASKRRVKSHKKRVDSYAYTPLTRPGMEKHLRGYLVTIDPETKHKGVEYHHEGEEFIYVLKGSITIKVGDNVTKLKEGGSMHFNSALIHKISNPSQETAELLVVIYMP